MHPLSDPKTPSFLPVSEHSDFPLQNIPFGVIERPDGIYVCASRIGDVAIDLNALQQLGYFDELELPEGLFGQEALNEFISLGRPVWRGVRQIIAALYAQGSKLEGNGKQREEIEWPIDQVEAVLPVLVGDYTDFYASREHATNVGSMFRDPDNALLPNWLHLPVGYHGRSSTIIESGMPVHRPHGQRKGPQDPAPVFGPSLKVDFELEMAFITGDGPVGYSSIPTARAEEHIFGLVLLNDWSARDIQQWEYVPLGPFLAKNFATSISPWIVTLDALAPFRTERPAQEDPSPLPYLQQDPAGANVDVHLEVSIAPEGHPETVVCESNFKHMYWSMAQQLAHHSINGCLINAGDCMGSGTISGPDKGSFGSMLEITWNGKEPISLSDGSERSFIEDNDTVTMRGYCKKDELRIGFGEVSATLKPALPWNPSSTSKN
ncbi:fumarylacetoacetase [Schleiferiaceae bacterium]|jgi:fumarylacetoacetase|nr:fumarylacetoacetase [Schleiferiaceae bacterium]